jgi:hypothetical protein
LIAHIDRDSDQLLELSDVINDIRDQFAGAVFFIKPQRKALQVLEQLLPDVNQHPHLNIVYQITVNIPEHAPGHKNQEH